MKINELSKSTHTNIETIRYYEKQGVLPPPKRLANGYRFYDEESIEQLNFIKKCR
ncbi:TPA: MerR family transcriptional regulator, partial [Haemophilus influenzae]